MKMLVTGGLGFVGRHVVRSLAYAGHEITVFDQAEGNTEGAARYVVDDLLHGTHLREALEGQGAVVHLAAHASVRGGTDNPSCDLEQNLIATARLIEYMRHASVKRLVFASSSAVYANPIIIPTPEDCITSEQTSFYGASKLAAEALISAYCHGFGLKATVLRIAPMLGEGYRRGHVYDFWRKLKADPNRIEVLGNGQQSRAYVYVGDAAAAVPLVLGWPMDDNFDVFNVGHHETATVDQSLDWICAEMGVGPERIYTGTSWAGDKPVTLLDTWKISGLDWQPTVSIEEAVRRTVRSFDD